MANEKIADASLKSFSVAQFETTSSSSKPLLQVYYNFAYYLCLSPYRLVDGKHGFQKVSFKNQKILCCFSVFLIFIRLIHRVRISVMDLYAEPNDPVMYFYFAKNGFSIFCKILLLKRFWLNTDDILDIINHSNAILPTPGFLHASNFVRLMFAATFIAATSLLGGIELNAGSHFLNHEKWLAGMLNESKRTFFVSWNPSRTKSSDVGSLEGVLLFLTSLAVFQRYIIGHFADLYIISHILTLWTSAHRFTSMTNVRNKLYVTSHVTWTSLYNEYKSVRDLSYSINKSLGGIVTCFMAEAIFFYSIHLEYAIRITEVARMLHFICYYGGAAAILILSADIPNNMDSVREWLAVDSNRESVPPGEWQIVVHELQVNTVGIKGNKMFTITYGFVGTVLTLIVIFFIICLQYRGAVTKTGP